ncbi:MAG: NAD(P)/FAD-dependent oxidoreductase [Candidatus Eremiobacteraeota bacterium]|nr:NAD(P)/FAD-dependent oxidoreductase [Candidatus Eremiobacteraeota bacterium]
MNDSMENTEVAIVGAGAAGLNAGLVLARARRSVTIFDDGEQRNTVADAMHGFISQDGRSPQGFLRLARAELHAYPKLRFIDGRVADISTASDGFSITLEDARRFDARVVLLATGVTDALPAIQGLESFWGRSAFVCPYCDGWEIADRRIVVFGDSALAVPLAQELYQWSRRITIAGAPKACSDEDAAWLSSTGVRATTASIVRASGTSGKLASVLLDDGSTLECDTLFLSARLHQHSKVALRLGCRLTDDDHIKIDECHRTSVAGIYAAGDATTRHHQVVIAAASGAKAAIAINSHLTDEETRAIVNRSLYVSDAGKAAK